MNSASAASSPFGNNAHRDVLEISIPDTESGRNRLLEELKNRGRSAVQAGQWPDAQALYKKALECVNSDQTTTTVTTTSEQQQQVAILHANLALVQGKMNQWNEAEYNSQKATVLDPSYTKGWWRLGQAQSALHKFTQAVRSMEQAHKLEPNNKALNKELVTLQQKAAAAMALPEANATANGKTSTTTKTDAVRIQKDSSSKPKEKKKSAAAAAGEPMDIDDTEEDAFTKSEHVKGYKVVNGKKTSYFHNELSEEAAKLIGDIAPKKLSEQNQQQPIAAAAAGKEATALDGTSAWNKAGTWEEKDVTTWAIESLQTQLLAVSYSFPESSPAPKAVVRTRKATVTGHASVATVRGKKRYIYELMIQLEWEFEDDTNGNEAHGTLHFPDFDGTCEVGQGYEATNFNIQHSDNNNARPLLEAFVHKQGWRNEIHSCMDHWVRLFQETYKK